MSVVRDVATVRVSEAVDGTKRQRRIRHTQRRLATRVAAVTVDPRVMTAAKQVRRPGEVLSIRSESEVWLVPKAAR